MPSIFSRIIAHELPATIIAEEANWIAILDLFPVEPGHVLVIPKQEVRFLHELSPAILADLGPTLKRISQAMIEGLPCDGLSVLVRDGAAAGQEVPHVHVHLVPRWIGKDYHGFKPGRYAADQAATLEAMKQTALRIRTALKV
jgi:histidine triad (HIT) family protein